MGRSGTSCLFLTDPFLPPGEGSIELPADLFADEGQDAVEVGKIGPLPIPYIVDGTPPGDDIAVAIHRLLPDPNHERKGLEYRVETRGGGISGLFRRRFGT